MNVHVNARAIDHRLTPAKGKMLGARGSIRFSAELKPAAPLDLVRQARARSQMRYRLQDAAGNFANIDLTGVAETANDGWIGFAHQLEAVRRIHPEFAAFKVAVVFPIGKSGILP